MFGHAEGKIHKLLGRVAEDIQAALVPFDADVQNGKKQLDRQTIERVVKLLEKAESEARTCHRISGNIHEMVEKELDWL